MTHVPFTSRLASFIGLPSNPSPKYDSRQDDSYIPYTGTYASPPASTSQHTHTHTHAHTLSGSTAHNPPSSTYSVTSNPHPYNPDRFVFLPPTASSPQMTMVEEERGRKRKSRPISTGSSFVSPSPLTEYHQNQSKSNPANPMVNVRRGGPSFIALDGGFIGQSPAPPPKDRWDIQREKEKQREREKGTYRTSLASFMTFGSSKRPSVSISISDPETGAGGAGGPRSLMGGPRSAQETYFPHGASKLRGEIPVGFGRMRDDGERTGAPEEDIMAPPAPAFLRQRSQSYVDETEATQRRRDEDRRRVDTLSNRERRRGPTSFFDTSTFDEHERDPFKSTPILPTGTTKPPPRTLNLNPLPHPYHRNKRQSVEHHPHHHQLQLQPESAVDLASPTSASFDFLHPYATATASTSNSSPSKSVLSRNSNIAVRPLLIPRKSVPDPGFGGDRYGPGPDRHRTYVRERESEDRPPHSAFPFINPFSSAPSHHPSPPVSRPVTPKGRLKSLAESGFKTIKGSISTPNLRQITLAVAEPRQEGTSRPGNQQINTRTRTGASLLVPSHAVLQGQTICDTFFFPRPRLQAHTISPPDSPFVAVSGRTQQQQVRSLPTTEARREWDRRDTLAVVEGVDALASRRDRGKEVVGKKVSAPDLRRPGKEKERIPRTSARTLTEAEKALKEIEEREREREEWSTQAKRSFQNKRSRSFSRSRTKSIAKASNAAASGGASAAASGDESDGKAVRERKRKHSGATSSSHAPLPAAPAATTTVGALTIRDEPREKRPDLERSLTFKSSMEYLAARAFSQGHQPAMSISGTSGTHSRHHSADHTREKEALGHRRSESWGKTLKKAKNVCMDPDNVSPGVDRVLPPFGQPASKSSHEISVLDIRPPTVDSHTKEETEETGTSAAVGIAIGTPPLDALLTTHAVHIEHPYGSPMASPSLPAFVMSDVVSRHRLPPRAHPTSTLSPPRSPDVVNNPAIPDLDAYVPTIESKNQPMLSRESWLVYMNELEDNVEHDREVERPGVLLEEEEPRSSADLAEDTPDLQLDLGSDASPRKNAQPQDSVESENQLTKAFRRRHSALSISGSSDNEHAEMVFEGGATLTRLLSSRSVTATPRMRAQDAQEGGRSIVSLVDLDDYNATLTRSSSTRAPIPVFDPSQIPIPNTASSADGAGFRTSAHSEVLSSSGHDNSWRKSIVSSEAAHSQDSSPKASPRAFVNLDDLEGYSDLFYHGGGGSTSGGRPKSGGSHKTATSATMGERGRRPELLQFGPKGSSALEVVERTFSPERTSSGSYYGSGVFSPPLHRQSRALDEAGEGSWRGSGPRQSGEGAFDRTWDPEEDDDDAYRLVNPNLPHMPVPIIPVHRHSTKLSVIEGSVDEHATASESTPDSAEQESVPPTSPTQPDLVQPQPPSLRPLPSTPTPIKLEALIIPSTSRHRTSSELAVGADPHARISMMTNTSGQSRISNLSDFPAPPTLEQNAFVLTPSNILDHPFPPRPSSPVPPATPASVLSVEPPTPSAEAHEGEDRSVSEHYHQGLHMTEIPSPREYRSNRATFGPESEIASQWTDRPFAATPTTEES